MNIKKLIKNVLSKHDSSNTNNPEIRRCSFQYIQKDGEEPVMFVNGKQVEPTEENIKDVFNCTDGLLMDDTMHNKFFAEWPSHIRSFIPDYCTDFMGGTQSQQTNSSSGWLGGPVFKKADDDFEDEIFKEDEHLLKELDEVFKAEEIVDDVFKTKHPAPLTDIKKDEELVGPEKEEDENASTRTEQSIVKFNSDLIDVFTNGPDQIGRAHV